MGILAFILSWYNGMMNSRRRQYQTISIPLIGGLSVEYTHLARGFLQFLCFSDLEVNLEKNATFKSNTMHDNSEM